LLGFKEKKEMIETTEIWDLYQKGIDYINKINLVSETDEAHRMYEGDQWYGLQSGNEKMPQYNFIKGIIKYKVAIIAQNTMSAVYSNMGQQSEEITKACELLNEHFRKMWELAKMDTQGWKIVKDSCIQGDGYLFFPTGNVMESQIIDNVNVLLGDEKNSNIQEQPYFIIVERRFEKDVKKDAKKNGIKKEDIDLIVADEDYQNQLGEKNDVVSKNGKCTSLLHMYKDDDGIVHFSRSVRNVVYQPDIILRATDSNGNLTGRGLKRYPLLPFIWEDKKGSARGVGEVKQLIPNQLEVNKTLARRSIAIQQNAYGKLAYNVNAIQNPEDLDVIGAKIEIKDGSAQNVNNMIAYLNPTTMSPDAKNFSDELVVTTKDLAGAGDSAQGSVDPTKASGAAIIAVRDQAALPLNEQIAKYKQFVEDLALLWFDIWVAYNPNGLEIEIEDEEQGTIQQVISAEILEGMKINVRIDVSQNNPYSRFAQEQALENLFNMQAITFEEYVEALDDDAAVPKGKLKDIIDKRAIQQQKEMQYQQTIQQLEQQVQQSLQVIDQIMGGGQIEMQGMPNGNAY
jgi:hypothetical protein